MFDASNYCVIAFGIVANLAFAIVSTVVVRTNTNALHSCGNYAWWDVLFYSVVCWIMFICWVAIRVFSLDISFHFDRVIKLQFIAFCTTIQAVATYFTLSKDCRGELHVKYPSLLGMLGAYAWISLIGIAALFVMGILTYLFVCCLRYSVTSPSVVVDDATVAIRGSNRISRDSRGSRDSRDSRDVVSFSYGSMEASIPNNDGYGAIVDV